MVVLLIGALGCLFGAVLKSTRSWRHAFYLTSLVGGVFASVTVELASLLQAVAPPFFAGAWGAAWLAAGVAWWRVPSGQRTAADPGFERWWIKLWFCAVLLALAWLAHLAMSTAPYDVDAMNYHLPRVLHWIQDRNVAVYPVLYANQLTVPPGVEYVLLHLHLLSGGDRFDNLVQLSSFVGCLVVASLIAKQFGMNARGQALAATLVFSTPLAILQSKVTLCDLAVAYWMMCLAYAVTRLIEKTTLTNMLSAAAAVALALFAKGTAYAICFPFAIWATWELLHRSRRDALRLAALSACAICIINGPFYWRNQRFLGSPAPDKVARPYDVSVDTHDPRKLLGNVFKHVTVQLNLSPTVDAGMERGVRAIHRWMGVNADDVGTTLWPWKFEIPRTPPYQEGAPGPIQLGLLLGLFWVVLDAKAAPLLRRYSCCCLAAAALLPLTFKWQPWLSRFQLGALLLAQPAAAAWLVPRLKRWQLPAGVALLLFYAQPYVRKQFSPARRPLEDSGDNRLSDYFVTRPGYEPIYRALGDVVEQEHIGQLGLMLHYEYLEYPLWMVLGRHGVERIEHVAIRRPYATRFIPEESEPFRSFVPDAILWRDESSSPPETFDFRGQRYRLIWTAERFGLLKRQP